MKVTSFSLGPFAANCVVLEPASGDEVFLVDPGFDVERVLVWLRERGKKPRAAILTHAHLDHAWGCAAVQEAFPGVPVWLHPGDLPLLENLSAQARLFGFPEPEHVAGEPVLEEGVELSLGGESVLVRHCPGHSPGHVVLLGDDHGSPWAVVGDLIFAGSVGRTDLWGGSWEQLEASIRQVIYGLPGETVLYPGHGPATTVGEERFTNPFVTGL